MKYIESLELSALQWRIEYMRCGIFDGKRDP